MLLLFIVLPAVLAVHPICRWFLCCSDEEISDKPAVPKPPPSPGPAVQPVRLSEAADSGADGFLEISLAPKLRISSIVQSAIRDLGAISDVLIRKAGNFVDLRLRDVGKLDRKTVGISEVLIPRKVATLVGLDASGKPILLEISRVEILVQARVMDGKVFWRVTLGENFSLVPKIGREIISFPAVGEVLERAFRNLLLPLLFLHSSPAAS